MAVEYLPFGELRILVDAKVKQDMSATWTVGRNDSASVKECFECTLELNPGATLWVRSVARASLPLRVYGEYICCITCALKNGLLT